MVDAVLIPGGGLTTSGGVTPWVQARLEQAISPMLHRPGS